MSHFKQRYITTKTDDATLTLSEMGEVVINKSTAINITIPSPVNCKGLWYRLINIGTGLATILVSATPQFDLATNTSALIMSDGTNWVKAMSTLTFEAPLSEDGGTVSLDIDTTALEIADNKLNVKSGVFADASHNHDGRYEPSGAVSTHEGKSVTDASGVHGLKIDSTPVDGKYLKWDNTAGKFIYDAPSGSGDMEKSTYDTNNNGKVDAAESADSVEWSNVQNKPTVFPPDSHNHSVDKTIYIAEWDSTVTYMTGDAVYYPTNAKFYKSKVDSNTNNTPPSTEDTNWVNISTGGSSGVNGIYVGSPLAVVDSLEDALTIDSTDIEATPATFIVNPTDWTILLLHFNGTAFTRDIIDSSSADYPHRIVPVNDVCLVNAIQKLGTGSLFLGALGSDYLTIADHASFDFGSGDFCEECFFNLTKAIPVYQYKHLISQRASATSNSCFTVSLYAPSSDAVQIFLSFTYNGTTQVTVAYDIPIPTVNIWYHLAVVRNGSNLDVYLDGVKRGTTYNIGSNTLYNSSAVLSIGIDNAGSGTSFFAGVFIDELRISKGAARYSSNFTPAVAEYSSDSYTKLLLHFDGSDDSTTFTDSGNTVHTVTPNGNAKLKTADFANIYEDSSGGGRSLTAVNITISDAQYKFGSRSAYCDGNGDYVKGTETAQYNYGTGAFTIDFWFRLETASRTNILYSHGGSNETAAVGGVVYVNSSNKLGYYCSGAKITGATTIVVDTWYHVAFVGNGGADGSRTLKLYLNGTQEGSTYTFNYNFAAREVWVGTNEDSTSECLKGWMDEFRISNNERWSSDFTPDTSAYSTDANTILLLHLEGTSVAPVFGTAMGKFDGNGDYLSVPVHNDFKFGSDNFCIEMRVRQTTTGGNYCPISRWGNGNSWNVQIGLAGDGANKLRFEYTCDGSESNLVLDWTQDYSWHHLVICREGNFLYMARDGVILGGKTISGSFADGTSDLYIGRMVGVTTKDWNGNIDELRISKGAARFSSSFTPPSSELSDDVNTSLLLHLNGSHGSQTFTDSSSNTHTVTKGGNAFIWGEPQIFGTACLFNTNNLMSGSNGYLALYHSEDWYLGDANFTIDFRVMFTRAVSGQYYYILCQKTANGTDVAINLYYYNNKIVFEYSTNGTSVTSTTFNTTINPFVAYHLAIVRNGTEVALYVNGTKDSTTRNIGTSVIYNSNSNIFICCNNNYGVGNNMYGFMDEFRVVRGAAKWTSGFTPPSSEY